MAIIGTVYKGYDNTVDLALKTNGINITHTGITRVQVVIGATVLDSLTTPTLFDLSHADRLILKLGSTSVAVGTHTAKLVIFDSSSTNGVVWGEISLRFV